MSTESKNMTSDEVKKARRAELNEKRTFIGEVEDLKDPSAADIRRYLEILQDNPQLAHWMYGVARVDPYLRILKRAAEDPSAGGADFVIDLARSAQMVNSLAEWEELEADRWPNDEEVVFDDLNWVLIAEGTAKLARELGWDGVMDHEQSRLKQDSPAYRALLEAGEHEGGDTPMGEESAAAARIICRFVDNNPGFKHRRDLLAAAAMRDRQLAKHRDDVPELTMGAMTSMVFSLRDIIKELGKLASSDEATVDAVLLLGHLVAFTRDNSTTPRVFRCLMQVLAMEPEDEETIALFVALAKRTGFRSFHDRAFGPVRGA